MSTYNTLLAASQRLINKYGREVIIRKRVQSGSSFDPVITNIDTTVKAVISNYSVSEIDGTIIERTDKKFLMIPDVAPEIDDLIVDGGEEYSVISDGIVSPGETTLLYKVQGRK